MGLEETMKSIESDNDFMNDEPEGKVEDKN